VAAVKAWKLPDSPRRRAGVFLLSIVIFILAFYSTSSSKLITYLLPILPPVAILLAAYFDRLLNHEQQGFRALRAPAASALVLGLLVLAGAVAGEWKGAPKALDLGVSRTLLDICCAILAVWGLALLAVAARKRTNELLAATAGGFVAMFVAALFVISSVAPQFTTPALIAYIQPGIRAGAEVDTLPFTQSVVFYSGERVEMLGLPSELAYGIKQMSKAERNAWVSAGDLDTTEIEHLLTDLKLPTPVYFVVRKNERTEQTLAKLPTPPTRIIENQRFVVIGNQAAVAITPPVQSKHS
jgi:4-amino-4-deoxy-L-arabinose transferase-like glycosyltransferase